MNRTYAIAIGVAGSFFVLLSCLLDWSHRPSYSLFTIADYSATYGKYVSFGEVATICAFLLPILACFPLICSVHAGLFRISSWVCGIYTALFAVIVLVATLKITSTLPTPMSTPGIYLALVGALLLVGSRFVARTTHHTQGT